MRVIGLLALAFLASPLIAAPRLDVRDFGAVGDGKADDTAAIQRCFDALPVTGGPIVLSPGTYRCTTTLKLTGKSNVTLTGQGALLDFVSAPAKPAMEHCLLVTGTEKQPIENPRLEGLRVRTVQGYGLSIAYFRSATIRDCTVHQSGLSGLYCSFGTGCLITGNHVIRGGDNGIYTFSVNDLSITGNIVEKSHGTGGIATMIGDGIVISGNTVRDSDIAGIGTWDLCRNVLITGNIVAGANNIGIEIEWNGDWDSRTRDVTVAGNVVTGAAQRGIQVYHGSCGDVVIRDNEIGRCRTGVILIDCEGVEITGNRISRSGQDGIWVSDEGNTTCSRILIERNRILNCNLQSIWNAFCGVRIGPRHREVRVSDNTIANEEQELKVWYEGPADAASFTYDCAILTLKEAGKSVKELHIADMPTERADKLAAAISAVPGWHAELIGPRFGLCPLFERSGNVPGNDRVVEVPCKGRAAGGALHAKRLLSGIMSAGDPATTVLEGNRISGVSGEPIARTP